MNLQPIIDLIEDIENEIATIKTVAEKSHLRHEPFSPMLVFYENSTTKNLLVAPYSEKEDFISKMVSIAETMHLHKATQGYAVQVSFTAKIEYDETLYEMLNILVMTFDYAFILNFPYIINEDATITWHSQYDTVRSIDDMEVDDIGKDMFSMFYHYIHTGSIGFSPTEILSYLAKSGAAIHQFNSKYTYFEPNSNE